MTLRQETATESRDRAFRFAERPVPPLAAQPRPRWITARSVLLGSLAVCLVCGLTPYNDYVVANTFLVGNYLPPALVLSFFVLVVAVLVAQSVMFNYLMTHAEMSAPTQSPNNRAAFVAADVGATLTDAPGSDLQQYLNRHYVGQPYRVYLVMRDGTTAANTALAPLAARPLISSDFTGTASSRVASGTKSARSPSPPGRRRRRPSRSAAWKSPSAPVVSPSAANLSRNAASPAKARPPPFRASSTPRAVKKTRSSSPSASLPTASLLAPRSRWSHRGSAGSRSSARHTSEVRRPRCVSRSHRRPSSQRSRSRSRRSAPSPRRSVARRRQRHWRRGWRASGSADGRNPWRSRS